MPVNGQTPKEREYTHGRYYAKGVHHGTRRSDAWTLRELEAILHSSESDEQLSLRLNRTIRAIQIARCRAMGRGKS